MQTRPPRDPQGQRRTALFYAAGDIGPSLTSLCLAFYWLYFLMEIAGLPAVHAGLIHASGYLVSAVANIWSGQWLDRYHPSARARCRLIVIGGVLLGLTFALLWVVPPPAWRTGWYLLLSWLFHLCFAVVYLAYLSLTALLGSSEKEHVDLSSYRFGSTMLLTLIVLGLHNTTEASWPLAQRLLALGMGVATLAAIGASLCGGGLERRLGSARAGGSGDEVASWRFLVRQPVLWWAAGANLAVWLMVQSALVLTAFLCASHGVSDARILLLMQVCIIVAAVLTSWAIRRWPADRVLGAAAVCWCGGAALWHGAVPLAAALLLGLGLGAGTVLSWARLPAALQQLAAGGTTGVDARLYAGLTVLRDLVSATVPLLVALVLNGQSAGSAEAGAAAAAVLISMALVTALALPLLQLVRARRPAGGYRADAPS